MGTMRFPNHRPKLKAVVGMVDDCLGKRENLVPGKCEESEPEHGDRRQLFLPLAGNYFFLFLISPAFRELLLSDL